MVGLAWVVVVALLAVPTLIYILQYSLPQNNTLPGWLQDLLDNTVAHFLISQCLSLYLSLVSSTFIPIISRKTARRMLGGPMSTSVSVKMNHQRRS